MTVKVLSFVTHASKPSNADEMIAQAFAWGVDYIAAQGTGTDWGAYWLGSGKQLDTRENLKENIRPYLKAAVEHGVPFVFSVGLAGGDVHLEEALDRVDELCEEHGWRLNIGILSGEVPLEFLREKIRAGVKIPAAAQHPDLSPEPTESDVDASIRVVALLGPEPIMDLLGAGVDGVITGRALDIGLHMSIAMMRGIPRAVAAHAGKVIECGGLACEGGSAIDPIWAELDESGFVVRSLNPKTPVTERSLVAHAFYERVHPSLEKNPGGTLDLRESTYQELEHGVVRCSGAAWIDEPYSVLMEGATLVGYRSITIIGAREPAFIANIDLMIAAMHSAIDIAPQTKAFKRGVDYDVKARVYGRDAVLGAYEPSDPRIDGHEVGVVIDVVAKTVALSEIIGLVAYQSMSLGPYPGRITTAGNVALAYMPVVLPAGPVYAFSVYHVLPLDDPGEPFRSWTSMFPRTKG